MKTIKFNISESNYQKLQDLINEWPAEDRMSVEKMLEREFQNVDVLIETLQLNNW